MPEYPSELSVLDPPASDAQPRVSETQPTATTAAPADTDVYTDGTYLEHNPTWHAEDSQWKAEQILGILGRNQVTPHSVCEVGCGAGEILVELKRSLPNDCDFWGYDISPQAHALAAFKTDDRLQFRLADLLQEPVTRFDLLLVIDLIEHVDDYLGLLRGLHSRAEHKVFHIPLDLSAYTVFRNHPIQHMRESVGHIHYFTADTALAALKDTGYEIIDWCFTPDDEPLSGLPIKQKLLTLLRRGLFRLSANLSVRAFGGRSILVLTR